MEENNITEQQFKEISRDFIGRLGFIKKATRPFIIVIGGFPGSGKTTAANYLAEKASATHIQANSARELLRERNFSWGKNVYVLMKTVLDTLLTQGSSVIVDGGMVEDAERENISEIASKHNVNIFWLAVTGDISLAKERGRKRFENQMISSFEDWKPNPDMVEKYFESMPERSQKLNEVLEKNPQIKAIDNSGSVDNLETQLDKVWLEIEPKIR